MDNDAYTPTSPQPAITQIFTITIVSVVLLGFSLMSIDAVSFFNANTPHEVSVYQYITITAISLLLSVADLGAILIQVLSGRFLEDNVNHPKKLMWMYRLILLLFLLGLLFFFLSIIFRVAYNYNGDVYVVPVILLIFSFLVTVALWLYTSPTCRSIC